MNVEQAKEDAFGALSRLEWLLLHAKPADFARIDMEREVPMAVEQVARVLRVTTQSAAMVTDILVARERERAAKVLDDQIAAWEAVNHDLFAEEISCLTVLAAKIRGGE